jgi:uncharacterized protein
MKNNIKTRYGAWGMIAGAAEGLGTAFCLNLAEQGMDLILADRQKELMEKLAHQLESSFGIRVKQVHLDLVSDEAVGILMEVIRETGCRLMIYNAAFSVVQKFMKNDRVMLDRYVQVNMRTPMQLVHSFCQFHAAGRDSRKGILLMSSLAGSWGTQLLGPYGGTKAFSHILAESLYFELKPDGFDVLACIAGATATPGYLASQPFGDTDPRGAMQPGRVVDVALRALGRRPFVLPGTSNKLIYFMMTRLLPRRISIRMMNHAVRNRYRDKL